MSRVGLSSDLLEEIYRTPHWASIDVRIVLRQLQESTHVTGSEDNLFKGM